MIYVRFEASLVLIFKIVLSYKKLSKCFITGVLTSESELFFLFLKILAHISAYYQSVPNFFYLIAARKNCSASVRGTYTGAGMKGNAFLRHSLSGDLFKT